MKCEAETLSSYGTISIAGREVYWLRNVVSDEFEMMFKRRDFKAGTAINQDCEEWDTQAYEISIATMLDRLDVMGITSAGCSDLFDSLVANKIGQLESWLQSDLSIHGEDVDDRCEMILLDGMEFRVWQQSVSDKWDEEIDPFSSSKPGSLGWFLELWDPVPDGRYKLRAIGEAFPNDVCVMEVSDLVSGGWYELARDPSDDAFARFQIELSTNTPAIVLAEGISDIEIISKSFELLRPQLDGYLRFFEFGSGAEGGAPALLRLVRAIAAAGIRNRIVAVFDNDAAAADCLKKLDPKTLPKNISVLRLPEIPIGKRYPTLGPTGNGLVDVNGLAGSIELYLGTDVLKQEDGELAPIQWGGYLPGINRYQGKFNRKQVLLEKFRSKCIAAESNKSHMAGQDWSGLELIVESIVGAVRTIPQSPPRLDPW